MPVTGRLLLLLAVPLAAPAQGASARPGPCTAHAAEAAQRSGLQVEIILRVMRAESGGNPRALSRRGAMGCMQIMPATWRKLTARHDLGGDPFEPRRNMIGGALYLADMKRQFGLPGAFAAYNAGPGRAARWRAGRAPLPAETLLYMARLSGGPAALSADRAPLGRWQDASLFAVTAADTRPGFGISDHAARASAPDALFPLGRTSRFKRRNLL